MLSPAPSFKISDIKPTTDEVSMVWVNLMSGFNGNDTVDITLGDVALRNGIANAWCLADALPVEFKNHIIAAILPSFYRTIDRVKVQDKYVKECKRLLYRYAKGRSIWEVDRANADRQLQIDVKNKDFSIAIEFCLGAACQLIRYMSNNKTNNSLIRLASINILNTVEPKDREFESQQQIVDVCTIFTPLITFVEPE